MSDDLVKRLLNPPFGAETSERLLMQSAAARIEALTAQLAQRDAALKAADELGKIAEMLLRMMDDVIAPTGRGDMAIVPDGSVSVISAWKTLAAYRKARGQDATEKG